MLSTADRRVAETFKQRLLTIVRPLDVRVFGSRHAEMRNEIQIWTFISKWKRSRRRCETR